MKELTISIYVLFLPVRLVGVIAGLLVKSFLAGYNYVMDTLEQYY